MILNAELNNLSELKINNKLLDEKIQNLKKNNMELLSQIQFLKKQLFIVKKESDSS